MADEPDHLFSRGNSKVGPHVFLFNLPTRKACPGMSPICERVCYAMPPGVWPRWLAKYEENLVAAGQPDFVRRAVVELQEREAILLRIHSSGDFFGAEYVRKWAEILRAVPQVTAWAYTRSWWSMREGRPSPAMIGELRRLASVENMRLWFSCDASMGLPPKVEGVRVAFLQDEGETLLDPEGEVELVFRVRRRWRPPAERLALPLAPATGSICPHHRGRETALTCETCRYCFL